jgi:sugar phosphate isomerase/epimerase
MKIGWCAPPDEAAQLRDLGYDYIEAPLAPMNFEDDGGFAAAKAEIAACALPIRAFNVYLPRDMIVVGPDIDERRIALYLARGAELMALAGAGIVVFGSAWARNIPAGFERARGEAQFEHMLHASADALRGTGVTLVIEPLNRGESNIVNSIAEGRRFAEIVDRPEVQVLADFYHMSEEAEPLSELAAHGNRLKHIHVADTHRLEPGSGTYPYEQFVSSLGSGGYSGMSSVECGSPIPEQGKRNALAFLHQVTAPLSFSAGEQA